MTNLADTLNQGDLRLRPPVDTDLPDLLRHLNDIRIVRWLAAVPQPFDTGAADGLLAHGMHAGENLRLIELGGSVAGGLCIGASLWYWLHPAFWRRGLMRRALDLAIPAYFTHPAPPLIATCHTENVASRSLLASLGFSPCLAGRRMFFQSTQSAEPCLDYLMAPEQWHLLHPPIIPVGRASLRPAQQKDARQLALILARVGGGVWPNADALPSFMENHRFRGQSRGLFVIIDEYRRCIGMALMTGYHADLCFLSDDDEARHRTNISAALANRMFSHA
ncbi:GNAT family N-acetyltransferase [Marivita sp.]|uniref:GNAT family N-acetyltransferase n=1 Tax=Marivita sp. TaxID=2003365 RepID=UPI002621EB20|nr:GNAT family N-acetyltransferase [Marivita sp.]